MEPKKFRTPNHEIINRFLKTEGVEKTFWGREIKLCNRLVKKYSIDFLRQLESPFATKFASLAWFLTPDGIKYLNVNYFEWKKNKLDLSPKMVQIELFETKIGADVEIKNKPKTLKDFLKV